MIRNDKNIKGVTVHNTEFKISHFSDDTTCFTSDQELLNATISSLELFSSYSGLRLNYEKSAQVYIGKGPCPSLSHQKLPIKQSAKILGIWSSKNRSDDQHYIWNYGPILDKMRKTCLAWNNGSLSLKGKVTVFNALIGSLIQYVSMNSVTPARVTTETRNLVPVGWKEKQNRISLSYPRHQKWGPQTHGSKLQDQGQSYQVDQKDPSSTSQLFCRDDKKHLGWGKHKPGFGFPKT